MNDKDIIKLYWKRDERAIKETDIAYGRFCYSLSYNILNNHEDVEECVNDTYLKTWNAIPPAYPNNLKSWIAKVVRNLSINRWKHTTRLKRSSEVTLLLEELDECIPAKESVEDIMEANRISELMDSWLLDLVANDRIIFVQRYWYGETVKNIALEHKEKPGVISKRLYKLRKQLHSYLEREKHG